MNINNAQERGGRGGHGHRCGQKGGAETPAATAKMTTNQTAEKSSKPNAFVDSEGKNLLKILLVVSFVLATFSNDHLIHLSLGQGSVFHLTLLVGKSHLDLTDCVSRYVSHV